MLILPILLQVADCVYPDTYLHRRQIEAGQRPSCEPEPERPADRDPTTAEQQEVEGYFDLILFDGESARWRYMYVRNGGNVCGLVNAKNQYGAYVGWTPFIYNLEDGTGSLYSDERLWFFTTICGDMD